MLKRWRPSLAIFAAALVLLAQARPSPAAPTPAGSPNPVIKVTVLFADKRTPAPSVRVVVEGTRFHAQYYGTTNAEGRVDIRAHRGEDFEVRAAHSQFGRASTILTIKDERDREEFPVTLTIESKSGKPPAWQLKVIVQGQDSKGNVAALKDAEVYFAGGKRKTNDQGEVLFKHDFTKGESGKIAVEAKGFESKIVTVVIGQGIAPGINRPFPWPWPISWWVENPVQSELIILDPERKTSQDLIVKALNLDSGAPIKNASVELLLRNPVVVDHRDKTIYAAASTGADGQALFTIPEEYLDNIKSIHVSHPDYEEKWENISPGDWKIGDAPIEKTVRLKFVPPKAEGPVFRLVRITDDPEKFAGRGGNGPEWVYSVNRSSASLGNYPSETNLQFQRTVTASGQPPAILKPGVKFDMSMTTATSGKNAGYSSAGLWSDLVDTQPDPPDAQDGRAFCGPNSSATVTFHCTATVSSLGWKDKGSVVVFVGGGPQMVWYEYEKAVPTPPSPSPGVIPTFPPPPRISAVRTPFPPPTASTPPSPLPVNSPQVSPPNLSYSPPPPPPTPQTPPPPSTPPAMQAETTPPTPMRSPPRSPPVPTPVAQTTPPSSTPPATQAETTPPTPMRSPPQSPAPTPLAQTPPLSSTPPTTQEETTPPIPTRSPLLPLAPTPVAQTPPSSSTPPATQPETTPPIPACSPTPALSPMPTLVSPPPATPAVSTHSVPPSPPPISSPSPTITPIPARRPPPTPSPTISALATLTPSPIAAPSPSPTSSPSSPPSPSATPTAPAQARILGFCTYLGGSFADEASSVAVDPSGCAYVTGATFSRNFPTQNPRQASLAGNSDVFVTKFHSSGSLLVYSTYLGGELSDYGISIVLASGEYACVSGETESGDFPTWNSYQASRAGGRDAFLFRLIPSGSALAYSSYLGGRGDDTARALCLDRGDRPFLTGMTTSNDFPTREAFQANRKGAGPDAFVTAFAPTGTSLAFSTYLGGSKIDEGSSIAVDQKGCALVTGFTESNDYPAVNPYQASRGGGKDTIITRFSATGSYLTFSTCFGGRGDDRGYSIRSELNGRIWVAGSTASADYPVRAPCQATLNNREGTCDAAVAMITDQGTLVYSSYLGGGGSDEAYAVLIDSTGNPILTGYTSSIDFPLRTPYQTSRSGGSDAFIAWLTPEGKDLTCSTYLGGSADDDGRTLCVDRQDTVFAAGRTSSYDFPTINPYQATFGGGSRDGWLAKLIGPLSLTPSVP